MCNSRVSLFGISLSSYVNILGNSVQPSPASCCDGTRIGDRLHETSSPQLPRLPAKPPALHPPPHWYRQVLVVVPVAFAPAPVVGFLAQILHYAANPLFSTWALLRGEIFSAFSFSHQSVPVTVPSWRRLNRTAFPRHLMSFGECSQPFPAGSSQSTQLCPSQIAKGLDPVPQRECQGRGDLALHLFFLGTKHSFKKPEPFHWQEIEAARDGQLPQLRFPARPLAQPCSLHVLHTHRPRMHCPEPQPALIRGLDPTSPDPGLHPSLPATSQP